MLFPFAPAKNRTSGPKGHKDDNVYTGDKSPAYPDDQPVMLAISSDSDEPIGSLSA
jgi:hypothetical protein